MLKQIRKIIFSTTICSMLILFSGCAINKELQNSPDPYEKFNRQVFAFNMSIDRILVRPVAKTYDFIFPWPLKKGVSNVFSNIGDVPCAANELLQFEFGQALTNLARVAINTTIGVGGLFDVATKWGLDKDYEDFGLTLARWGAKDSPYLVMPFLGSSTVRDAIALPVNYAANPLTYVSPVAVNYGVKAADLIQRRARLLPGDNVIEQAFDPYVFVRDAYLQRRAYLIVDNDNKHGIKHFKDEEGTNRRKHHDVSTSKIVTD